MANRVAYIYEHSKWVKSFYIKSVAALLAPSRLIRPECCRYCCNLLPGNADGPFRSWFWFDLTLEVNIVWLYIWADDINCFAEIFPWWVTSDSLLLYIVHVKCNACSATAQNHQVVVPLRDTRRPNKTKSIQDRHLTKISHPDLFRGKLLNLLHNRVSNLLGGRRTTQVPSENAPLTDILDTVKKLLRSVFLTQPGQHLRSCPKCSHGVGNALSSDVECRPVNWFEHAGILARRVQIGGRRNTNRASQGRSKVRQDIGVLNP